MDLSQFYVYADPTQKAEQRFSYFPCIRPLLLISRYSNAKNYGHYLRWIVATIDTCIHATLRNAAHNRDDSPETRRYAGIHCLMTINLDRRKGLSSAFLRVRSKRQQARPFGRNCVLRGRHCAFLQAVPPDPLATPVHRRARLVQPGFAAVAPRLQTAALAAALDAATSPHCKKSATRVRTCLLIASFLPRPGETRRRGSDEIEQEGGSCRLDQQRVLCAGGSIRTGSIIPRGLCFGRERLCSLILSRRYYRHRQPTRSVAE